VSSRAPGSGRREVVRISLPPLGQFGDYAVSHDIGVLSPGDIVVVEGPRGRSLGEVRGPRRSAENGTGGQIRKVVRPASAEDLACQKRAEEKEDIAFRTGLKIIRSRQLTWRLIAVHADGLAGTMTLCIAAKERQDVKEFARDLGRSLGMKTLVRQIGLRDSARFLEGLGRCGRELCCSSFLTDYPATNIRTAKDQQVALSPEKTQGQCGGTLCCLAYEHEDYLERGVWLPKVGKKTRTLDGLEGRVSSVNALRLTFTLVDGKRRRHVLDAQEWEGNRGKQVPLPDATYKEADLSTSFREVASPTSPALAQSAGQTGNAVRETKK
jgi:cell fate regulator YaaT (PSP1 superfamily)